jgi:hypothetical protein
VVAAANAAMGGAPAGKDDAPSWIKKYVDDNNKRRANPDTLRRIAGVALGAEPLDDLEDRIRRQARADELEKNRAMAELKSYSRFGSVGGMPGPGTLTRAGVTAAKIKAERDMGVAARKERVAAQVEARATRRGLSPEEQEVLRRRASELKTRAAEIRAGAQAAMADDDRDLA